MSSSWCHVGPQAPRAHSMHWAGTDGAVRTRGENFHEGREVYLRLTDENTARVRAEGLLGLRERMGQSRAAL